MSRSKRKTPILKVADARPGSMKAWKKLCNKKFRRNVSVEMDIPPVKKHSDVWGSPSDGKTPYASPYRGDDDEWKKLMRK